jgi:hypothetical protein
LTLLAALIAWFALLSKAETTSLQVSDNRVALSGSLPGDWDSVCILSPYSTSAMAREVTGTRVNVELQSSISSSDSISLLITMKGGRVMNLFEVSRGNVDFSGLGGECYPRENSIFSIPHNGHPHALPARQADRITRPTESRNTPGSRNTGD